MQLEVRCSSADVDDDDERMALKEDALVSRLGTLTVKTGKWCKDIKDDDEEEEPLSPVAQLYYDPGFSCHIVYFVGIGTRIDVDVLKSGLQSTLLRHPRFSSIPVFDKKGKMVARWVRTKVSIDDHTVIPDVDPAVAAASPDRVVEDYAYSLSRTPLDTSRPLWDLHILNFPTSKAAAVLLFRIHHSLGDGTSLTSLILACTHKTSELNSLQAFPLSRRPPTPRLRTKPPTFSQRLRVLLVLLWHTLVDVLLVAATYAFLKDTSTPLKGAAGVAQRPKRFVHRIINLDDIKDIKDAVSCTVNDVLMGVTSAALTRYIDRKYNESTGDDNKKKQLPLNIRLRSSLIVNIRPTKKLPALSELMEGKNGLKWGNQIGYWLMPFPIVKYEDPLEYVRKGKAIADRKKNSLEAILTFQSGVLFIKCFGTKLAAALCKRMHFNTSFTFSNLVGPVEEIGFYGHPIAYLAPGVYGNPHALTLHFQSYMNTMTVVLGADESAIPDPHRLLDDFFESLKLMKEAIPAKSLCIQGVTD